MGYSLSGIMCGYIRVVNTNEVEDEHWPITGSMFKKIVIYDTER